ncbi:MAG: SWIM zinc finger family protein [Gloeocapsa sp. UFS-A4-WI-NPMV-4B04]|nr:SWIM zinc finger family protein [Gloeocapsa sp. UFS-A4-WI-NPMV-4B04]
MSPFTNAQILALAPDASSAKNGKTLATLRKWVSLGQNEQVIWGECQGSGKTPYQTQIDLTEIAFKCSCPSRKFPCKHGLGLLLLRSNEPAAFNS